MLVRFRAESRRPNASSNSVRKRDKPLAAHENGGCPGRDIRLSQYSSKRPTLHRGIGPVVRQTQDNGVAWTTVRAVDVGIPVAPVGWIEELFQTRIADREIGRDANRGLLAALALSDGELGQADRSCAMHFDFCDAGCRWVAAFSGREQKPAVLVPHLPR